MPIVKFYRQDLHVCIHRPELAWSGIFYSKTWTCAKFVRSKRQSPKSKRPYLGTNPTSKIQRADLAFGARQPEILTTTQFGAGCLIPLVHQFFARTYFPAPQRGNRRWRCGFETASNTSMQRDCECEHVYFSFFTSYMG